MSKLFEVLDHKPSRQKEAFHDYLQQHGVVDGLLVGLNKMYDNPQEPPDAVQFVRDALPTKVVPKIVGPRALPGETTGTVKREKWGTVQGGRDVELFTLTNPSGSYVRCMPWGATIVGIHVPDRCGTLRDVALGFDSFDEYMGQRNPCMGAVPGRVANRIAHGAFTLNGVEHQLQKNNGEHHLHGGGQGFHKRLWEAEVCEGASVAFTLTSKHGDMKYPGHLTARVTYTWTDDNCLRMDYEAVVEGKPTLCGLTNHTYFNLNGPCAVDVKDHLMMLKCSQYTPTSEDLIPTGELAPVEETAYDFREGKLIKKDLEAVTHGTGYDTNFVVDKPKGAGPHTLAPFALVMEPETGISMEVATTFPGVQLFTANDECVQGITGKLSTVYPAHAGFCLETQNFPDAINHPDTFPSPVLNPGEKYTHRSVYKFGVQPVMAPLIEGKDDSSPPVLKWMELPVSFRPPPPVDENAEPEVEIPAKAAGKPKGKK